MRTVPGSDRVTVTGIDHDGLVSVVPVTGEVQLDADEIALQAGLPNGPACLLVHEESAGLADLRQLRLEGELVSGRRSDAAATSGIGCCLRIGRTISIAYRRLPTMDGRRHLRCHASRSTKTSSMITRNSRNQYGPPSRKRSKTSRSIPTPACTWRSSRRAWTTASAQSGSTSSG